MNNDKSEKFECVIESNFTFQIHIDKWGTANSERSLPCHVSYAQSREEEQTELLFWPMDHTFPSPRRQRSRFFSPKIGRFLDCWAKSHWFSFDLAYDVTTIKSNNFFIRSYVEENYLNQSWSLIYSLSFEYIIVLHERVYLKFPVGKSLFPYFKM